MPETATPPAAPIKTGFDMYDPEKDPRVQASNDRTMRAIDALDAQRAGAAAGDNGKQTKPKGEGKPLVPAAVDRVKPEAKTTFKHAGIDLMRAKQLGFSAEDCSTVPPNELKELLQEAAFSALAVRTGTSPNRAAGSNGAQSGGGDPGLPLGDIINLNAPIDPPAAPANPAAPAAGDRDKARKALVAKLKESVSEEVADALVEYVDGIVGDMPTRLERFEGDLRDVSGFVHGKRSQEADNEIDQGFADLGEAYQAIFGEGNAEAIDRDSAAFSRRCDIAGQINKAFQGKKIKPGDIRRAVAALGRKKFADMVGDEGDGGGAPAEPAPKNKPAPRPAAGVSNGRFKREHYTEAEANAAALATPTGRASQPLPLGRAKATETVRAIQAAGGEDEDGGINQGKDQFLPSR